MLLLSHQVGNLCPQLLRRGAFPPPVVLQRLQQFSFLVNPRAQDFSIGLANLG